MLRSLALGFRAVLRNWGLVLLVLSASLVLALLAAAPFALLLEHDLAHGGAAPGMAQGLDYDWWSARDAGAGGLLSSFGPDLAGTGFAFRNFELLLHGQLPLGLFARQGGPDPTLLALAALYLLLQAYLSGGLLGVFRADAGGWTLRGFLHGCGFYFGRLLLLSLLALAGAALVFAAYWPLAHWLDGLARQAVSERTALALTLGGQALLALALLLLHGLSSYAKVILVSEQRQSALLAFVSSLGFCARNLGAACGQYLLVIAAGSALLALFGLADGRLQVSGWLTQLLAIGLVETFVACRIALRLGLLAAQVALHGARGR